MTTPSDMTHGNKRSRRAVLLALAAGLATILGLHHLRPAGQDLQENVVTSPPCPCHALGDIPERNPLPVTQNTLASVQYHRDIAPLIHAQCLTCHQAGGIAPFGLESYIDVASFAYAISDAVHARRMPPFNVNNQGTCQTFKDARWLSDEEIATIGRWVAEGFPEGHATTRHPQSKEAPSARFEADLVFDTGYDYTPTPGPGGPDSYRCFPVETGLAEDVYISAFHVQPQTSSQVHHVNLWSVDDPADAERLLRADGENGSPGFDCGSTAFSGSWIGGWAPGVQPVRWPDETGIRLPAEGILVFEIHYFTSEVQGSDRTKALLETSSSVTRPVLFGMLDIPNFKLSPGNPQATVSQSFAGEDLPDDFLLLGVIPHMHELGRTLYAEWTGDEESLCLVDVDRWNFHWQHFYFYESPIRLSRSEPSEFSLRCAYDTSGLTQKVGSGMSTDEEMCQVALIYLGEEIE